jgi:hypothetical protein
MEGEMTTDVMTPTAKLRWVQNNDELKLQQWWSNADSVKMGPVHMIKGEWRDVEVVDDAQGKIE